MTRLLETLFGPLFLKEMLEISRRRRYYVLRVAYVGVLLAIAYGVWREPLRQRGSNVGIQEAAKLGDELFRQIALAQMFSLPLLLPLLLAGSFCDERRIGSLDLLFVTPLSDREILFGKVGAQAVVMLLLVAASVPFLTLTTLFGGIAFERVCRVEGVTAALLICIASLSLNYAVDSRTRAESVIRSYIWMVVLALASLAVYFSVYDPSTPGGMDAWTILQFVLLLAAVTTLAFRGALRSLRRQRATGTLTTVDDLGQGVPGKAPRPAAGASRAPRKPANQFVIPDDAPLHALVDGFCRTAMGVNWPLRTFGDSVLTLVALFALLIALPVAVIVVLCTAEGLVMAWIVGVLACSLFAGSNPLLSPLGVCRDLVLLLPAEPSAILRSALQVIREPLQIVGLIAAGALMWRFALDAAGTAAFTLLAAIFAALAVVNATMCCMTATTRFQAIAGSVGFPAAVIGVPPLLELGAHALGNAGLYLLTIVALLFAVGSWRSYRQQATTANAAALFLTLHLALLGVFVMAPALLLSDHRSPLSLINPTHWLYESVHGSLLSGISRQPLLAQGELGYLAGYLVSLAINLAIVICWLRLDFDRLVDRPHRTPRNPEPAASSLVVESAP